MHLQGHSQNLTACLESFCCLLHDGLGLEDLQPAISHRQGADMVGY